MRQGIGRRGDELWRLRWGQRLTALVWVFSFSNALDTLLQKGSGFYANFRENLGGWLGQLVLGVYLAASVACDVQDQSESAFLSALLLLHLKYTPSLLSVKASSVKVPEVNSPKVGQQDCVPAGDVRGECHPCLHWLLDAACVPWLLALPSMFIAGSRGSSSDSKPIISL